MASSVAHPLPARPRLPPRGPLRGAWPRQLLARDLARRGHRHRGTRPRASRDGGRARPRHPRHRLPRPRREPLAARRPPQWRPQPARLPPRPAAPGLPAAVHLRCRGPRPPARPRDHGPEPGEVYRVLLHRASAAALARAGRRSARRPVAHPARRPQGAGHGWTGRPGADRLRRGLLTRPAPDRASRCDRPARPAVGRRDRQRRPALRCRPPGLDRGGGRPYRLRYQCTSLPWRRRCT